MIIVSVLGRRVSKRPCHRILPDLLEERGVEQGGQGQGLRL